MFETVIQRHSETNRVTDLVTSTSCEAPTRSLIVMKIAMIGQKGIPAHSGGIEQHVQMLSHLLVEHGHEVIVYCRRSYCAEVGENECTTGPIRVFRPSIATKHLDAITHTISCTWDVL